MAARNGDLTEPWLFLIGSDGTILDRWCPLFDPARSQPSSPRSRGGREPPGDTPKHEHFGPADAAALATREGRRATWISLGLLALTAVLQLGIVAISGSVALLADTIHNFTDALTAIPLLSRSGLHDARRPAATRTATTGPRTSQGSRSWR